MPDTMLHNRVLDALLDRRFDEPTILDRSVAHDRRVSSSARRSHWLFRHAVRRGQHWIWDAKRSSDGYPLVWLPRREIIEVLYSEEGGRYSVEQSDDKARFVHVRNLIGFRLLAMLMYLDWDWDLFKSERLRERRNWYTDLGAFPDGHPSQAQRARDENWWMRTVRFTMKCGVQTCVRPTHVRLEPRDVYDVGPAWLDDPTTRVRFFHPYLQQGKAR